MRGASGGRGTPYTIILKKDGSVASTVEGQISIEAMRARIEAALQE